MFVGGDGIMELMGQQLGQGEDYQLFKECED